MMMRQKVRQYIERHRMAEWREPLWVAVSGGVDSMVLLHLLRTLRHPCHVVHIDHGLRGSESDLDHQFVKQYCENNKIPFVGERVDVNELAQRKGISVQMAARELRYEFFSKLTAQGPPRLALAHHQDDAIETLILQLIQGMGAHSWQMIPPIAGPFIRPLMEISREEIMKYAEENSIQYREDRSNSDPHYLRNRIRHELLPLIESWRPGVRRSLARTVELSREIDHLIKVHLEQKLDNEVDGRGERKIPIASIMESGTPKLILHHLLRSHGFHPDRLEDILIALEARRTGTTFTGNGIEVIVDRDHLLMAPIEEPPRSWTINSLDQLPFDLPLEFTITSADRIDLSEGPTVAWLDLTTITFPLIYRPWRSGDRIRPIGLDGSKLISDILIDAKMPRNEKQKVMVLESGAEIVWLPSFRISDRHKATPDTEKVLRVALRS